MYNEHEHPEFDPKSTMPFIDVSRFRVVNYAELPDTVKLVVTKATEGTGYYDPTFEEQVEKALEAGKFVGAYHFYRTKVGGYIVPPIEQAEFYIEKTKQYENDLAIDALDFEYIHVNGRIYNPKLGNEQQELKKWFTRLVEERNKFRLLYTSSGSWSNFGMANWSNAWQGPRWMRDGAEGLINAVWQARYSDYEPFIIKPFKDWWAWQFSGTYAIDGVYAGNLDGSAGEARGVDANYLNHPWEEVEQMLAGFVTNPPTTPPTIPPVDPPPVEPPPVVDPPPPNLEDWMKATDESITNLLTYTTANRVRIVQLENGENFAYIPNAKVIVKKTKLRSAANNDGPFVLFEGDEFMLIGNGLDGTKTVVVMHGKVPWQGVIDKGTYKKLF